MYKTEVIGYTPSAKNMEKKIESKCNEMEQNGFCLISTTITLSAKAILVFKKWVIKNIYQSGRYFFF